MTSPSDAEAPAAQPGPPDRSTPASRARRELLVAVLGCLVGAGMLLLAAGRPWLHAVVEDPPYPRTDVSVTGRTLSAATTALALVGLAGVAAVAATRGRGRIVLGIVLALAGLGAAVSAARWQVSVTALAPVVADQLRRGGTVTVVSVARTAMPWVAVAGGLLLAASGVLVAVRGPHWSALSSRYEAPAGRAPTATRPQAPAAAPTPGGGNPAAAGTDGAAERAPGEVPAVTGTGASPAVTDAAAWDALDRGEDPTRG